MAQFVKMENGNLLNASCIAQIRPHAGINYNSKRLKVDASIIVEGSEFGGDLIAATAVVPWPNPDNEVEAYNLLCGERNRLERTICDFFSGHHSRHFGGFENLLSAVLDPRTASASCRKHRGENRGRDAKNGGKR